MSLQVLAFNMKRMIYRWYDRLQTGGLEALEDKASRPTRVWNRIPDAIRKRIVLGLSAAQGC